ncbi:MAG TPA: AAA family ATPase [Acidimicrobiales bacterium]|nr:AAA family ATPase [Acidimicrobiales bacterium]
MVNRVQSIAKRAKARVAAWQLARRRRRVSKGRPPKRGGLLALVAALVVLLGAVVWCFDALQPADRGVELSIDRLTRLIAAGDVREAVVRDEDLRITGEVRVHGDAAQRERYTAFWTAVPRGDASLTRLIQAFNDAKVPVRVDSQSSKATVRTVLTTLLPLAILANLFALFFVGGRRGGSALGEVLLFGQLRKRGPTKRSVGFHDVAGVDEAIEELREVVEYLESPERFEAAGVAPPKGILLFGPPGCGKTLLAKAVAGEAGVPFFSVAGAEFVESLVGVGAARVRDLFARVRASAPAIVFIDELDAAGRRRGSGTGGGSDERDQTLNQLLVEMDGFETSSGIVVIGATNRADILDPALLRPGRFDRHIVIERPDAERRQAILRLHASKVQPDDGVDFGRLAALTAGFCGAELAGVVNEAALLALRAGSPTVQFAHFSEGIDRVAHGSQRRGVLLDDAERHRIAVHEAGHAVVAALVGFGAAIERVSVLARGRVLASVEHAEGDALLLTEDQARRRLATLLAGRSAEVVLCGSASTGAEDDLAAATALGLDLAGRYGMSRLGPRRLLGRDADVHLGGTAAVDTSEAWRERLDAEVDRLLAEAQAQALRLVTAHRRSVVALADALVRHETLDAPDLASLLPDPLAAVANGKKKARAGA